MCLCPQCCVNTLGFLNGITLQINLVKKNKLARGGIYIQILFTDQIKNLTRNKMTLKASLLITVLYLKTCYFGFRISYNTQLLV